jgi:hypothetical protein
VLGVQTGYGGVWVIRDFSDHECQLLRPTDSGGGGGGSGGGQEQVREIPVVGSGGSRQADDLCTPHVALVLCYVSDGQQTACTFTGVC